MSLKKKKGSKIKANKILPAILLAMVALEVLFLVRAYFKEQSVPSQTAFNLGDSPRPVRKIIKPLTAPVPAPQIAFRPIPRRPQPRPEIPEVQAPRGKIAIIIDDSGYNVRDCRYLEDIKSPVTVSILPNLKYSTDIARCAHTYQKEVMLHLPLEPHENSDHYPDGYIIQTQMPTGRIIDRLTAALASVPYADGINNHMGSKATENRRLMAIIFNQLKARHLFFVDSRVTSKTVCPRLARETRLPFAQRDVFLDNVNRRPEIEKQFAELSRIARERGFAVGIGHARELTWEIIEEQTEKLKEQGFEIVPVKDIVAK